MNAPVETPHPSPAETLRAEYADQWDIWRELTLDGKHGDWIAEHRTEQTRLTAPTIEGLAALLRKAES